VDSSLLRVEDGGLKGLITLRNHSLRTIVAAEGSVCGITCCSREMIFTVVGEALYSPVGPAPLREAGLSEVARFCQVVGLASEICLLCARRVFSPELLRATRSRPNWIVLRVELGRPNSTLVRLKKGFGWIQWRVN